MAFLPDGADTSVLPVPRLFSDVAMLAGFATTRSEDLVYRLRIMLDAVDANGVSSRIAPTAMARLRATGMAILDDIEGFELGSTSQAHQQAW